MKDYRERQEERRERYEERADRAQAESDAKGRAGMDKFRQMDGRGSI